jgi:hypothetical protein
MGEFDFASFPAAWSNIPADGYDIAAEAVKAAAQGAPVRLRFITGITGKDGTWPEAVVAIGADGIVTASEGCDPVVRNGRITGLRLPDLADG